jgi:ubiquinone/menaquinone biosynthesis C-methylase UbiE
MYPDQVEERRIRNEEAEIYDDIQKRYRTRWFLWARNKLIAYLLRRSSCILDAGCGTGLLLPHISSVRRQVVGVDFSEISLGVARRKSHSSLLCCADLRQLPFPDAYFDAIVNLAVLQHIPSDLMLPTLKEFARVSRDGATFIVQVYNADTAARFGRETGDGRYEIGLYYHSFSLDEIVGLLCRAGWNPVKISGFGCLRYIMCHVRGGESVYKCFAYWLAPIDSILALMGGERIARKGEFLHLLCSRAF